MGTSYKANLLPDSEISGDRDPGREPIVIERNGSGPQLLVSGDLTITPAQRGEFAFPRKCVLDGMSPGQSGQSGVDYPVTE